MITIKPVQIQTFPAVVTADRCEVMQISVLPGQGASGSVVLGTSDLGPDDTEIFRPLQGAITVAMTAAQYAAWGTDDDYAVNCLLGNLGLVRA